MMKSLKRLTILLSLCSFVGLTACNTKGDSIQYYQNMPGTITYKQSKLFFLADDNATLVYVNSGLPSTLYPGDRIIADFTINTDQQLATGEYLIADFVAYAELPTDPSTLLSGSQSFDDFGTDPFSYLSELYMFYGNGYLTVFPFVHAQSYDKTDNFRFSLIFDENSYDAVNNPHTYPFELRLNKNGDTGGTECLVCRSFLLDHASIAQGSDLTFTIRYKTNNRYANGSVTDETIVYRYTVPSTGSSN